MPIARKKISAVHCHRTGFGFDSHVFAGTGTLVLGGLRFPGTPSLRGHSDGDVLLHAVIDALLGAACLGDIGDMFPDSSKRFKGASSKIFLQKALGRVHASGWIPVHVDVTILADTPRLEPVKRKLRTILAKILKLKPASISIKAKTQEGLRLFAPPGGIAVWAIATLATSSPRR